MKWINNLIKRPRQSGENPEPEKPQPVPERPHPMAQQAVPSKANDYAIRHQPAETKDQLKQPVAAGGGARPFAPPVPGIAGEVVERRIRRATDSILENESLTSDLEDAPASELINWGVACARAVAQQTTGMEEDQAEQLLSDGMGATRRLIRSVSAWATGQEPDDPQARVEWLDQIISQGFIPPDQDRRQIFLEQIAGSSADPAQKIASLRALFE
jgi:hypothetical protein